MVGLNRPQDEGRKSRCKLVTTMTNRSSHMPMFTTIEITKRIGTLVRTLLNHRNCGVTTLQKMSSAYAHQYGPVMRFHIMNVSYRLPLYHAMNASIE